MNMLIKLESGPIKSQTNILAKAGTGLGWPNGLRANLNSGQNLDQVLGLMTKSIQFSARTRASLWPSLVRFEPSPKHLA